MNANEQLYHVVVWYGKEVAVLYEDLPIRKAMLKSDRALTVMEASAVEIISA